MVHTEEFKSSVKLRWLIDCAIMDRTGAQKWRYDIKNLFNTTTNPYPDQQIEFGLKKLDNKKKGWNRIMKNEKYKPMTL